ncbi:Hint domain-containing protein [Arenibacterium sp. CAU 1754]
MFLNHTQEFAAFETATLTPRTTEPQRPPMPRRREISAFLSGTMLETPTGWRPVDDLHQGDRVYTLDGGFATLQAATRRTLPAGPHQQWHVPTGSLGNCCDLTLSAGQYVVLHQSPQHALFEDPFVLAPIAAMSGFAGIAPVAGYRPVTATQLFFDDEEIVYAQTGSLLHVPTLSADKAFFRKLSYGETRAILSVIAKGHCALDPHGFAPAHAA